MLTLPTSRGYVSLASASVADPPVFDPNYFASATDRVTLVYGVKRLFRVLSDTEAGKDFIEYEVAPPRTPELNLQSEDPDIDQRIRVVDIPYAHAAGTMAMGEVVDSELKVYGAEGVRVADASVFPLVIAGHPQATLYALAEKAASIILSS